MKESITKLLLGLLLCGGSGYAQNNPTPKDAEAVQQERILMKGMNAPLGFQQLNSTLSPINTVTLQQQGSGNQIEVAQQHHNGNPDPNIATVLQQGNGNTADISQNGGGNEAALSQVGNGNHAGINQAGNDNRVDLDVQADNKTTNVTQEGEGLSFVKSVDASGASFDESQGDPGMIVQQQGLNHQIIETGEGAQLNQFKIQQKGEGMKIIISGNRFGTPVPENAVEE